MTYMPADFDSTPRSIPQLVSMLRLGMRTRAKELGVRLGWDRSLLQLERVINTWAMHNLTGGLEAAIEDVSGLGLSFSIESDHALLLRSCRAMLAVAAELGALAEASRELHQARVYHHRGHRKGWDHCLRNSRESYSQAIRLLADKTLIFAVTS